jgi:thiol-disulfide isomerase/thioredoxin
MRRTHVLVIAALVLLLIGAGVVTYVVRNRAVQAERDQAEAALFSEEAQEAFTDLEGREVDLAGVEGEIIIATSWASWCPQCAGELELLNEVVRERNDDRVKVLALNRMEQKYQAQRFMATLPELEKITFVLDNQDHFFGSVEGYAMPETIFYNEAGEIVLHKRGNLTKEEALAALDAAFRTE